MPSNKVKGRLTKLEDKASAVNRIKTGIEFLVALPNETDIEAIQNRLAKSKHEKYNITLLRRKGSGFESTRYTQDLVKLCEPSFYPHPGRGGIALDLQTKRQSDMLWRGCNNIVCRVDGFGRYRHDELLKLDEV